MTRNSFGKTVHVMTPPTRDPILPRSRSRGQVASEARSLGQSNADLICPERIGHPGQENAQGTLKGEHCMTTVVTGAGLIGTAFAQNAIARGPDYQRTIRTRKSLRRTNTSPEDPGYPRS